MISWSGWGLRIGIGLWLGTGDPKSLKVREIFDKVWLGTGDPKKLKVGEILDQGSVNKQSPKLDLTIP